MRGLRRLTLQSAALGLVLIGGFFLWIWFTLPDPSILLRRYPVVESKGPGEEPVIRFSSKRPRLWVSLGAVSAHARAAILISEDGKFYSHKGLDVEELKNAIKTDLAHLEFKRGASTITQQLVKNVFLSRKKTLLRKFQELILTFRSERLLSKQKILETYLNVIEFGPNLYGIGPASYRYFEKPASDLTAKEGAFLAMLLPSPVKYSSSFRQKELTPYAKKIIRMLLRKMVILGHLTREEAEAQWETPLSFEDVPEPESEPTLDESESQDEQEGPADTDESEETEVSEQAGYQEPASPDESPARLPFRSDLR